MKRRDNLYEDIYSFENLERAVNRARQGKEEQYGVQVYDRRPVTNLVLLHCMLKHKTYRTSAYKTFTVKDPKERLISCLPFFPDRIAHHAIMGVLESHFVSMFTADSYSCIKGRGIHGFDRSMKKVLRDVPGTQFCLKIDIKKFYPSIDHRILKRQLRRKFKDEDLLWLLDDIIDSSPGVPIGNYLSQFFANFYLTGFDHWLKEVVGVKYYLRYADDIVILAPTKEYLHELLAKIRAYMHDHLKLTVKHNYQVFPVAKRGINVVGYVYRHGGYVKMRPSIKRSLCRAVARKRRNTRSIDSLMGWAKTAKTRHLMKKLNLNEKLLPHEQRN